MTERQLLLITDFAPDVIACTPSYALTLAQEFKRARRRARRDQPPLCGRRRRAVDARRCGRRSTRGLGVRAVQHLRPVRGDRARASPCECIEERSGLARQRGPLPGRGRRPRERRAAGRGRGGRARLHRPHEAGDAAHPLLDGRSREPLVGAVQLRPDARPDERDPGRTDDMLIIRGVNVFPTQVEDVLGRFAELAPPLPARRSAASGTLDEVEVRAELTERLLPLHRGRAAARTTRSRPTTRSATLRGRAADLIKDSIGCTMKVASSAPGALPRWRAASSPACVDDPGAGRGADAARRRRRRALGSSSSAARWSRSTPSSPTASAAAPSRGARLRGGRAASPISCRPRARSPPSESSRRRTSRGSRSTRGSSSPTCSHTRAPGFHLSTRCHSRRRRRSRCSTNSRAKAASTSARSASTARTTSATSPTQNHAFLNSEDDASAAALEVGRRPRPARRRDPRRRPARRPATHPKYAGRRIFGSGINLTHLYHGKISLVEFLLERELGQVCKIYRGTIWRRSTRTCSRAPREAVDRRRRHLRDRRRLPVAARDGPRGRRDRLVLQRCPRARRASSPAARTCACRGSSGSASPARRSSSPPVPSGQPRRADDRRRGGAGRRDGRGDPARRDGARSAPARRASSPTAWRCAAQEPLDLSAAT